MRRKSVGTAAVLGLVAAAIGMVSTAGAHRVYSSLADAAGDGTNVFVGGVLQGTGVDPVPANHNNHGQQHSDNFRRLDNERILHGRKGSHAEGSDLAFRNRLMVAGTYQGTGFFRMNRSRTDVEQIGFHNCPGSQGDVSLLGEYVFVSIDSPDSNDKEAPGCNDTGTNGRQQDQSASSLGKQGIRIVDISNIDNPRQVGFVETECGSHTHTIIPTGGDSAFLYVDSYPLRPEAGCTETTHDEGEFSVVKFDGDRPERAHVVSVPDVMPEVGNNDAVGCHDTGVLLRKNKPDLGACAGLGRWVLMNIEQPADPKVLAVVNNLRMELDHSAAFSWDGKVAVIGDEHAGAAGGGGCSTDSDSPVGAAWFYDITNVRNPQLKGHHSLPRVPQPDSVEEAERFRCTTHNYNVIPTEDRDRYLMSVPYYMGGIAVVNFSNPANPREAGFFLPNVDGELPDMWSAYWYNGKIFTNEHSSELGVSVFKRFGTGARSTRYFSGTMNPQTQVGPLR